GHIDSDRWYDLKVIVNSNNVKCWIDGDLIHDVNYDLASKVASIYSVAATDEKTGDLIVKVVNANGKPMDTEINLGAAKLTGQGTAIVLTSENGTDENSLAEPTKVSPKTETVSFDGASLKRSFPGNSF